MFPPPEKHATLIKEKQYFIVLICISFISDKTKHYLLVIYILKFPVHNQFSSTLKQRESRQWPVVLYTSTNSVNTIKWYHFCGSIKIINSESIFHTCVTFQNSTGGKGNLYLEIKFQSSEIKGAKPFSKPVSTGQMRVTQIFKDQQ